MVPIDYRNERAGLTTCPYESSGPGALNYPTHLPYLPYPPYPPHPPHPPYGERSERP